MLAFDCFHVEVYRTAFGIAADRGIAGVSKRAGLTIAETSDIVFVAAEVLLLCRSVG